MHDDDDTPRQTRAPGERRLDRAPSDRYRATDGRATAAREGDDQGRGSLARSIAYGVVASIVGALAIVVFGGVLAVSAGLLVVAGLLGYGVAQATTAGGGTVVPGTTRRWIAASTALDGQLLGQLGLWLYARTEGGVLPLFDYLGQTFGVLVPLQFLIAIAVAWWTAR